jgi:hypothetical protein
VSWVFSVSGVRYAPLVRESATKSVGKPDAGNPHVRFDERGRETGRCIIYIVRRTQLYLDDDLWNALHARARSRKTTISELVRDAVRERYLGKRDARVNAMQEFVGIRKERAGSHDAVDSIRSLRRGLRVDQLHKA